MKKLMTLFLVAAGVAAGCSKDEIVPSGNGSSAEQEGSGTVSHLTDAGLKWSESTCSVILEDQTHTYPSLSNPNGLTVSYASSNSNVATIDTNGSITLVGSGSASISATSAATETYAAGDASFILMVRTSEDTGAGSYIFGSTGDPESADDISGTTFTRKITVTFASGGASVTGDAYGFVTVNGNKVSVNNTGEEFIVYELTGTAADGSFTLYSQKKQALLLNGLSLTCSTGAAINNQSGKRTFVVVEGTNTLADGASASYATSGTEDMKAVFFSEGQLVFSGSGSLSVTANNKQGKSCITSDDYVRIMNSPSLKLTAGSSAGHGIKVNDFVQMGGGSLNISTAAATKKGINSEDYVLVEGGTTTINVSGGTAYDSEDKEYKGSAGIKADNYFGMTGGTLSITNTGAGGKGIHAGSYDYLTANTDVKALTDSYISGGTLTIKTTGSESNDVSSKGIKIGYKQGSGRSYTYGGNLTVSGGSVNVTVSKSEGFETKGTLTFDGGQTYVYSTGDDAINSQGQMTINKGYIYAYSTANDALDTNCDMKINGGYVFAVTTKGTPEVALDANTEGGYKLYIYSGATVVAYGGLESGYSSANTVQSLSGTANAWNALATSDGTAIAAFKAPSGLSSFAVCAPSLSKGYKGVTVSGTTYAGGVWATSGISGGTAVSLGTYSGGGGPGGGGPGGPGGGFPGGPGW